MIATLIVSRGAARVSRYEVRFGAGASVLDGLRQVRASIDPTLGFRHSCINANSCKECMIVIDGRVGYACMVRLEPREMRLEPLPNKALLRDLVTEIAPPDERLDHAIEELKR